MTPDLSIIVLTYNSADLVRHCLASLPAASRDRSVEILVVDNASFDGTAALVRREFPHARLIQMPENTGFARANNAGMARAGGRHVLLLNPDTVVRPGALDHLVDFLEAHPEAGVAAPQLLNTDLTDQGTARAFPSPSAAVFGRRSPLTRMFPRNPWARRYLIGRQRRPGDVATFEVDWVSGACLMLSRTALARVGGFDERFFMYWEDTDLCRRVKDSGLTVHCVPAAQVVHHEGGSRRGWPPRQVWIFHQSVFRYYSKHHAKGPWIVARPFVAAALVARAALAIAGNRRRTLPARGIEPALTVEAR